jgi:hypothetical protein
MTINDTQNKINTLFGATPSTTKTENSAALSTFEEEFQKQLASNSSTNSNPNKPAATELSESDAMVEEFKNTLGKKGALTFLQDYNADKIQKILDEKKAELMDKLGLNNDSTQPALTGDARSEALSTLDQMMSDFKKQLMEKLNADDKLSQQNTMLSTFLQKMS